MVFKPLSASSATLALNSALWCFFAGIFIPLYCTDLTLILSQFTVQFLGSTILLKGYNFRRCLIKDSGRRPISLGETTDSPAPPP
jgi:hypothetical protein